MDSGSEPSSSLNKRPTEGSKGRAMCFYCKKIVRRDRMKNHISSILIFPELPIIIDKLLQQDGIPLILREKMCCVKHTAVIYLV